MASGRLFAVDLAATTYNSPYAVPASVVCTMNVNICNRNATTVKVRLAVAAATGTPGVTEFIEYDTMLAPYGVLERTGLVLAATQRITAYSDTANVSVVGYGFEE
jgi:hypothetical protein